MLTPDQEIVLRTLEDVRGALREYISSGRKDAARMIERLLMVIDKRDVVQALDQMNRRRVLRLLD